MISRRLLLCAGASALGVSVLPRRVSAKRPEPATIPTLPLFFSVAEEQGAPVRDDTWIGEQLAEAFRLFSPLGLSFRKRAGLALPESLARLETRDDRDALAAHLEPKVIHVMLVSSLRDVDDPKLYRMGVHWRHRKKPAKHWVIVAASARPSTLAHELGHYFGLDHSSTTDNLMSYSRTGAPPFLDAAQSERVKAMARMYVSSKLVLPA